MPTLTVDGLEVAVEPGATLLQACERAGREIPRFCYHERLSIAGNCRMCLVELERSPKPVASCAMPAADGMKVRTDSALVRRAREGVMEFLLINHPLDCPVCDQGGECDLQDQALAYGRDRGRYDENKRAVADKDFGPLVATVMTRCIHCTRCVRFMDEVAGAPQLGGLYRGEDMEIAGAIERGLSSELSGNIVDLCPVGALTSKPHAFAVRSWELTATETVDALDAVGSAIRVDSRAGQVMRVLPRLNEAVNEEWIADKTRYACDGLRRRRLDRPWLRDGDGRLKPAGWDEAFAAIAERVHAGGGARFGAVAGDLCDAESMCALRDLAEALGSPHIDCRQDGAPLPAAPRAAYLFNTTIAGTEAADLCLLVGADPRREAPLVAARLRKRRRAGGFALASVGPDPELGFPVRRLGDGPDALAEIASGRHEFARDIERAERPMIVLGMGALARPDGAAILALGHAIAERFGLVRDGWNGFNVLHTAAARVAGLDLGLVPGGGGMDAAGMVRAAGEGGLDVLYLLGADELDPEPGRGSFVVYQGHHGDRGARCADVILPGAAWTEKPGTYVNTEGRVQRARRAVFPPGDAREDWRILRALSAALGAPLPYDDLAALRRRMAGLCPHFARVDEAAPAAWGAFGAPAAPDPAPFAPPIADYYRTDPISRASETMAQCSRAFVAPARRSGAGGG